MILLGDPQHNIDDVAGILEHAGIEIKINCSPFDGARVLVFVSCVQGISGTTLDILEQWNGRKISIPAVIMTQASPGLDTDTVELVFMETKWVLLDKPGADTGAGGLVFLRSDDIFIADKLKEILKGPLPPVVFQCNRKKYELNRV